MAHSKLIETWPRCGRIAGGSAGGAGGVSFSNPHRLTMLERDAQLRGVEEVFHRNAQRAREGNTEKALHTFLGAQAGQGAGKTRFAREIAGYCAWAWSARVEVALLDFARGSRLDSRDAAELTTADAAGADGLSHLLGARIQARLRWGEPLEAAREECDAARQPLYVPLARALEAGRKAVGVPGSEDLHVVVVLDGYDRIYEFFKVTCKLREAVATARTRAFVEQLGALMVAVDDGGTQSSFSRDTRIFVHTFMCATQGNHLFSASPYAFDINETVVLEPFQRLDTLMSLLKESGVRAEGSADGDTHLLHAAWLVRHPGEFVRFVAELQRQLRDNPGDVVSASSLIDVALTWSLEQRCRARLSGAVNSRLLPSVLCAAMLEEEIDTPVVLRSDVDDAMTLAECASRLGVLHSTGSRATFSVADLFRLAAAARPAVLPKRIRVSGRFYNAADFASFGACTTAARVWVSRLKIEEIASDCVASTTLSEMFPGATFYPDTDADILVRLPNRFRAVTKVERKLWSSTEARPSASTLKAACPDAHNLLSNEEPLFDCLHTFESEGEEDAVWVITRHEGYTDDMDMESSGLADWFDDAHGAVSAIRNDPELKVKVIVMWVTSSRMTDDALRVVDGTRGSALVSGRSATEAWPEQLVRLYQIRPPREFVGAT